MGGGYSTAPPRLRHERRRGWPVPAPHPGGDPQSIHHGVSHCRQKQACNSTLLTRFKEFSISKAAWVCCRCLKHQWPCTGTRQLCSDAGAAPRRSKAGARRRRQALPAQAALMRTLPLLTGSFMAWKAALPLFSPSEDINSYSGQIRNWKRQ